MVKPHSSLHLELVGEHFQRGLHLRFHSGQLRIPLLGLEDLDGAVGDELELLRESFEQSDRLVAREVVDGLRVLDGDLDGVCGG